MKRSITGQSENGRMTVGELRRFLDAIPGITEDTPLRIKKGYRGYVRAVTVEEDDASQRFLSSLLGEDDDNNEDITTKRSTKR